MERAGLRQFDVIVALDGWRVTSQERYRLVRGLSLDARMRLIVWRDGRHVEVAAVSPTRRLDFNTETYER